MIGTGGRGVLTAVIVLAVASCSQPGGPTSALSPLSGAWRTAPIPSGSGIDLTLTTSGAAVSGTGHQYSLQYLVGAFTVKGRQETGGSVSVSATYENGSRASFIGRLAGPDELVGTWSTAGHEGVPTTFYRQ